MDERSEGTDNDFYQNVVETELTYSSTQKVEINVREFRVPIDGPPFFHPPVNQKFGDFPISVPNAAIYKAS